MRTIQIYRTIIKKSKTLTITIKMSSKKSSRIQSYAHIYHGGAIKSNYCVIAITDTNINPDNYCQELVNYYGKDIRGFYYKSLCTVDEINEKFNNDYEVKVSIRKNKISRKIEDNEDNEYNNIDSSDEEYEKVEYENENEGKKANNKELQLYNLAKLREEDSNILFKGVFTYCKTVLSRIVSNEPEKQLKGISIGEMPKKTPKKNKTEPETKSKPKSESKNLVNKSKDNKTTPFTSTSEPHKSKPMDNNSSDEEESEEESEKSSDEEESEEDKKKVSNKIIPSVKLVSDNKNKGKNNKENEKDKGKSKSENKNTIKQNNKNITMHNSSDESDEEDSEEEN